MEKLLLYCTKGKPRLYRCLDGKWRTSDNCNGWVFSKDSVFFNGKIVAECECDLVERFTTNYFMDREQTMRIAKDSCLTLDELVEYEERGNNCSYLHGLHLKNVKIFDKPLTFKTDYIYKKWSGNETVQKAPQSMMVVYDRFGNRYMLLPIYPEHLCKILNGEKTIEVRRRIVKELKELIK